MAKVDRKNKENQQGEKHSLSSFEKKRGAKVAFNYAQARTNKKYRVVNVQRESRSNSPVDTVSHLDKPTAVSENGENKKNVKNTASRTFANGQTANRRMESRTPDAVQKSESAVTQPEKTITPEIAQRMKRAAFLQEQNNAKIKMNTASAAVSKTEHSPEQISDTNSAPVITANDSGEKKSYEHKYVSQTADSIIPEQKKAITPEMALRMKRAAFIAQKNEEAIRLNRASVVSEEENRDIISYENDDYPEETENVPLEHQEEQEETQGSSYLGNSEHAVFDTYNNDVRAYRARNAYGDYVKKQKRNAKESSIDRLAGTAQTVGEISRGEYGKLMTDAVVGSLAGEEAQNVINGIGTVGQAVSGSDSVGSTVLDVSSTLAAIEAKKLVKKLAETDIKKKHRAEERMKNHGNRYGIDKYDEVTGKNEKSKDTKKNADRHSEAPDKKQGSNKVGSSHKLQQEKQEYAKTQRAKEIRGKQKEIFIKENRKISNTLYSAASGKSEIFRRIFAKKGASLIVGGGAAAVAIPIFLVIIVFILILAFFGWLSPFSYGLAGEDPETEHNAETKAEVIDGYALMVKNYMDVTQAYYYLNYGDWYGGTYQYESAELDFASFFADYCDSIVAEIQAYYQPLIEQASSPAQAMAISRAMSEAIRQALANAQTAAYQEYSQLVSTLDDEFTPTEHRQHYEVEVTNGGNGIDDSVDFYDKPIPGTNNFGNVEINSELSAEELLAYIALYKSLLTLNPDDTPADPDAEDEEESVNITPQDIMDFFEETEFFSITTNITHNNPCINQNCKRRLIGDAENGYSWEYYCDSDHDNLTGEIGACLTADELLAKVMELTGSEDLGVDEDACKELIESYLDMFKEELNIDEDDFRKFGAADNEKAQEFYQLLIIDELHNADLWEVDTPFSDDEE